MSNPARRLRRLTPLVGAVAAAALVLSACGDSDDDSAKSASASAAPATSAGSSSAASSAAAASSSTDAAPAASESSSASSSAPPAGDKEPGSTKFVYLGQTENTTIAGTLKTLGANACKDANAAAPISFQTSPGPTYDQKFQLLGGQDALPNVAMAAGTPDLNKQFIEAGKLQNLSQALESTGTTDRILPAAASTIKALYGSEDLYALPTEFNIEGFWYNKKIFADNGITPPATWDDLVKATATLTAAGVQPFTADGKGGWNITRYVGNYIFRDLGADALQKVADGQAKLTDPEYVKAADAIAALGKAGAFGKAPGSIDYNGSLNTFLTGKAAMLYMGSWALANFQDPKQNQIGADTIGYMPFPAVAGGKGDINEVPANVGVPIIFASKGYGSNVDAWIKCIAENYGDTVLKDNAVISGFKINNAPADLPALTKSTQEVINSATKSVLWFEALFTAKATTVAQTNAASLAGGKMSGADFMAKVMEANAK